MNPVAAIMIVAFLAWLAWDIIRTPITPDEKDDTTDFYNN